MHYKLYTLVSGICYFIRLLWFPNPFSNWFPEIATMVNYIVGFVFLPFARLLTKIWYSGDDPIKGSVIYLINYFLLTVLLLGITLFITNIGWVIALFILGYIVLIYIECKLRDFEPWFFKKG